MLAKWGTYQFKSINWSTYLSFYIYYFIIIIIVSIIRKINIY
jgi:hypothetical protein